MRVFVCVVCAFAVSATAAPAQNWNDCKHEAQRAVSVAVGDAQLLSLKAGAGSLKVEGNPGLTSAVIRGRACASDGDLLEDIKLEARRNGNRIVVRANVQDSRRRSFRNNEYARLDLVMEVPAGMAAEIEDGSGSIDLANLGDVELDDGSGEIVGTKLTSIRVNDGSGAIRLSDISGTVRIKDGSGEISLRNIGGAIEIEDGSGEINIRGARGNVRISDSSGGIDVSDVAGDFIVEQDGSGAISHDNVRGRVEIPRRKR